METLRELVSSDAPDMRTIERHLDGLDASARVDEIRSLGRAAQSRLFDAAEDKIFEDFNAWIFPERIFGRFSLRHTFYNLGGPIVMCKF